MSYDPETQKVRDRATKVATQRCRSHPHGYPEATYEGEIEVWHDEISCRYFITHTGRWEEVKSYFPVEGDKAHFRAATGIYSTLTT